MIVSPSSPQKVIIVYKNKMLYIFFSKKKESTKTEANRVENLEDHRLFFYSINHLFYFG